MQIENYEVFFANTLNNNELNISRIAAYVHNDINKKLRRDLMSDTFSSIWFELGHPRQKRILVCQE